MVAIFMGDNEDFLVSFAQDIKGFETRVIGTLEPHSVKSEMTQFPENIELFLIDINYPKNNFKSCFQHLKNKWPKANFWALFDSKSKFLRQELHRLGFKRIISYKDDLNQMIAHDFVSQPI